MYYPMNFGHKIKSLRNKRNWNVKDVADKLQVHPDTVYKWERDQAQPRRPQLKDLAKLFEVEIESFFMASDEEKRKELFSSEKAETQASQSPSQSSNDITLKAMSYMENMLKMYQEDSATLRKENESLREEIRSLKSKIENMESKTNESSVQYPKGIASGE